MIHNIEAIYDHGVFRPVQPVVLPEGTRVSLRVEEDAKAANSSNGKSSYETWLDSVAGSWQGEFVRGNEGIVESREPLS
jgi:predicted DNA-binding antitoxin AbrB/MazE fold protein